MCIRDSTRTLHRASPSLKSLPASKSADQLLSGISCSSFRSSLSKFLDVYKRQALHDLRMQVVQRVPPKGPAIILFPNGSQLVSAAHHLHMLCALQPQPAGGSGLNHKAVVCLLYTSKFQLSVMGSEGCFTGRKPSQSRLTPCQLSRRASFMSANHPMQKSSPLDRKSVE